VSAGAAPAQPAGPAGAPPSGVPAAAPEAQSGAPEAQSGFRARGRVRRRARFLRKARELAYRDLGGLVFNLHRFGQRNDSLVLAKLGTLTQIDGELRATEVALSSREPITVLREAGVTACPRCAAIHSSEDRFCPGCGLALDRHTDLPIAGTVSAPAPAPAAAPAAAATAPPGAPAAPAAPAPTDPSAPATSPPSAPAAPRGSSPGDAPATASADVAVPAPATDASARGAQAPSRAAHESSQAQSAVAVEPAAPAETAADEPPTRVLGPRASGA
jgi:hypothetical protein